MAYRYSELRKRSTDDRHLQDRDGLGADRGHPVSRQLPAGGSRGERHRAVYRTGFQSVRPMAPDGDPCGPSQRATLQQCLDTGVPAATSTETVCWSALPAKTASCRANPDLVPEEPDTYTYGVILQPRFLPNWPCRSTPLTSRSPTGSELRPGERARLPATKTTILSPAPTSTATRLRSPVAWRWQRQGPEHQYLWLPDEGLGPEPQLFPGPRARPVRLAQLQPDGHPPRRAGRGSRRRIYAAVRLRGHVQWRMRRREGGAESRMAASLPHGLGIAVECRRVPHLALLRLVEPSSACLPARSSWTSNSTSRTTSTCGWVGM